MNFLGRFGWAIIIAVAILWAPFMNELAKRSFGPPPVVDGPVAADPQLLDRLDAMSRDAQRLSIDLDDALRRLRKIEQELERRGDPGPNAAPGPSFGSAPAAGFEAAPSVAAGSAFDPGAASQAASGSGSGSGSSSGSGSGGDAVAARPAMPDASVRYVSLVQPPERRTVNDTLDPSGHAWLEEFFGPPRVGRDYSQECQEPDNKRLLSNLKLESVGPFRVRMLRPALDSLKRIFAKVQEEEPELYAILGSAGSLCGRLVRGSADTVSGHAYGAALDVTIAGSLDEMGDAKTQLGLVLLHEYFREEGWFWGVAFRREDSMHFEVSRQTLQAWKAQGAFDLTHSIPKGGRASSKAAAPEVVQ
jgi:hypothetical protein